MEQIADEPNEFFREFTNPTANVLELPINKFILSLLMNSDEVSRVVIPSIYPNMKIFTWNILRIPTRTLSRLKPEKAYVCALHFMYSDFFFFFYFVLLHRLTKKRTPGYYYSTATLHPPPFNSLHLSRSLFLLLTLLALSQPCNNSLPHRKRLLRPRSAVWRRCGYIGLQGPYSRLRRPRKYECINA